MVGRPEQSLHKVYKQGRVVGAPAFCAPDRVRIFLRKGAVVELCAAPDGWRSEELVNLGYGVQRAWLSPGGAFAAWVSPGRRLLVSSLEDFGPKSVTGSENCVDCDWEDSKNLLCLMRENQWALPGCFHAQFQVKRVDAESGETQLLPRALGG